MVLFDEPISLSAIVGMGIILLGTLLVTGSIFRSDNLLDSKEC
jgi:drug/metabolite transporter (DMT)-like permease